MGIGFILYVDFIVQSRSCLAPNDKHISSSAEYFPTFVPTLKESSYNCQHGVWSPSTALKSAPSTSHECSHVTINSPKLHDRYDLIQPAPGRLRGTIRRHMLTQGYAVKPELACTTSVVWFRLLAQINALA